MPSSHLDAGSARISTHGIGRVVTIDLVPGDPVVASVLRAADDLDVRSASVSFVGTLSAARLILGRRKYSRATDDPDRVSFDDAREAFGSGELVEQGPGGALQLQLRCAIGKEREVFVADIVEATVGSGARVRLIELVSQI